MAKKTKKEKSHEHPEKKAKKKDSNRFNIKREAKKKIKDLRGS